MIDKPCTIRGWCPICGRRHDENLPPLPRVAHPSTLGCRIHGITRCTICFAPCPCECNRGGFCGGCGHAGCGVARTSDRSPGGGRA